MKIYRAMVDGKIEPRIFMATSLDAAQVAMMRFYKGHCNSANIIAMTEKEAMEKLNIFCHEF